MTWCWIAPPPSSPAILPPVEITREPSRSQLDKRPTVHYTAPCDRCDEPLAPWRSAVTIVDAMPGTTNAGLAYCDHDCEPVQFWQDAA